MRVLSWRLRVRRLERKLTQEKAAERAEMSLKRYQHMELGIRFNPTLSTFFNLCRALDLDMETLFKNPTPDEVELSKRKVLKRAPKKTK
jgi:transcriptional regulator with XRE-family HTH domain